MLAHRLLGGGSSSLSISCPSLGSTLIAAACARLWRSFRQCSASPLLEHPETMVSCLLGRSRLFPRLPPSQLWRTSPLQAVFKQPTPVLSLGSDLRSPSLSSQPPLAPASEQTKPLGLVSAGRHRSSARESLRFALCTPVAALSSVAPILPPCPPHRSAPVKGLPSVWKLFLLHGSLPEVQVPSLFFCLCLFVFFLLPYPGTWGVFAFWEV